MTDMQDYGILFERIVDLYNVGVERERRLLDNRVTWDGKLKERGLNSRRYGEKKNKQHDNQDG